MQDGVGVLRVPVSTPIAGRGQDGQADTAAVSVAMRKSRVWPGLTGTGASAARSYWEEGQENARAAGQAPTPVSIPVGFTTFPGEIWRTPRSWVEKAYPNVIYFNEVDKGGHFAAWEEPGLFSEELRAAFRPLR
jgi:pimeloyl-ACP methyl ester carboxylesterase